VFEISALTHQGCDALVKAAYLHVHAEQSRDAPAPPVDQRFAPVPSA
jgi:GTP-binding protein